MFIYISVYTYIYLHIKTYEKMKNLFTISTCWSVILILCMCQFFSFNVLTFTTRESIGKWIR